MKYLFYFLSLLLISACKQTTEKLPILGEPSIVNGDTIYPRIAPFSFINQDNDTITHEYFSGRIYVADFIFLSCPTICPRMTQELKYVYDEFQSNPEILFLSHTTDPDRDTPEQLKRYTAALGIDTRKWNFVTGTRDSLYHIAENSYYATAYADSTAPGGFVHSGGLILVDKDRHIRGVYDGTEHNETIRLIKDIRILLNEYSRQ